MRFLLFPFLFLLVFSVEARQKYEYGLFENFEGTKAIFEAEKKFLEELRGLRESLKTSRDAAVDKLERTPDLFGVASRWRNPVESSASTFPKDITNEEDMIGALTGVMVLRDFYNLKLSKLARGRVESASRSPLAPPPFGKTFSNSSEFMLDHFDLANMGKVAFDRQW